MSAEQSVLNQNAEPDWKNYDDFARGIDTNRLPGTQDWRGKTLQIAFESSGEITLRFSADRQRVLWAWGGESGEDAYEEVQTSAARYFFNIPLQSPGNECLTLVFNRDSGRALLVRSTLLPEQTVEKGSRLKQSFHVGRIVGATPGGVAPHLTRELIGYRTLNVYSPNHYYEHFYVNTERYAWQNLRGEQFGHGDMDYATYYKFEDEMFLFTFREKIIPVCSVFFFDFISGRCTGTFLGLDAAGRVLVSPAGAFISKMSYNAYPEGVQPL
ncbi:MULTISPECIES: MoaF C-terminal domain-containing protein [unclassified Serratia (in: enterobacteria)]|uniref:MoaF C-terminal domain-containing protein n=1 Tax=unclassified Serratia (in: enterobacteria) TaxID=2647522 RepID=UPI0027E5F9D7|nr:MULTISPECIES: MoaF C-terminal domain-containing protein [unclassified Serratia (in: enterobacteria)]MDQ7099795.1 MoaF C-terminal domain-containing protein [Serratia sp. MF2]MDQ7106316.1 MoaF C-terminal domain-containing protein [Serratia sp. MF1(2023)]